MSDEKPENSGEKTGGEIDTSLQAEASSAKSRINIPLNLSNWRHLPQKIQEDMMWWHQHLLDHKMSLDDAAEALGFDRSNIFKQLKGMYEGNWANVQKAIDSWRNHIEKIGEESQEERFVNTKASKLVWGGLNYALSNHSITLITGESRSGKTMAALEWRRLNNHGRSVYVIVPPFLGGSKMLLRAIAEAVGVNRNMDVPGMYSAVCRSFNKHRILIVDEAHRLLPSDRRSTPALVEMIRDIHDRTGAAVALLATERFDSELRRSNYQFEQLLGRIGMPIRLPRRIDTGDVRAILTQYVPTPGADLLKTLVDLANQPGRLGFLVQTLRLGSRMAKKAKVAMAENHIVEALRARREMMGEIQFAK